MKILCAIAIMLAGTVSAVMADGKEIYEAKCAKCHGDNGEGKERATLKLCKGYTVEELRIDRMNDKSDEEVRKIVIEGKEKMPAYADKLTDEEIDQVIAYCRELAKPAE